MDIKDFIAKFSAQFYETDPAEFKPDTYFKELDEWSSLSVITTIAMIDAEYGVTIDGQIIRQSDTIEDLFKAVCELKK